MFEKEAKEAFKKRYPNNIAINSYYVEGFKDCAKSRLNVTTISDYPIKDEWHDLEKDPTDLPKEEKQYVVKAKDLDGDITVWICWYWTETKTFTGSYLNEMNVIKWKEIE